jgi:hypothetical protein
VHDRTVDGEALVFGNQGALFMNAMTWWDHRTGSVWSLVWGRALDGELKGKELKLLPSQLVPWKTWKEEHPGTLALNLGGLGLRREPFYGRYVIGVTLEDAALAIPYEQAEEVGLINDAVGLHPVVIHVDPESSSVHVYLRRVEERELTFVQNGQVVQDQETGSTWSMDRGLAVEGPLQGQALRPLPYISAYPNAWRDFYPRSLWYNDS